MSSAGDGSVTAHRLFVIANRLHVTVKKTANGLYDISPSSGGLVTALSGLKQLISFLWYGTPGVEIADDQIDHLTQKLRVQYNSVPILLDKDVAEGHYNGFSSKLRRVLSSVSLLTRL